MTERLDAAVAPLGVEPGAVRVRPFHALGREILRDAGVAVEPLADRPAVLAEVAPWADEADLLRLDTAVSRLKVELGVTAVDVAADADAGPVARAFVAYEAAVAASGGLDSTTSSCGRSPGSSATRTCSPAGAGAAGSSWSTRSRTSISPSSARPAAGGPGQPHLPRRRRRPVDLRLAARGRPADPGLEALLPGLRRVDLEVNYRCPRRSWNGPSGSSSTTGSGSRRRSGRGRRRAGGWSWRRTPSDETIRLERAIRTWPADGTTRAVLARTNRELLPAVVVALGLGLAFRAPRIELLLESPLVDDLLARAAESAIER